MKPVFKPFEPADADAVVTMMQEFYDIDNYPIDAAGSRDLFLEFTKNEGLGRGWLVMHDAKPVGYVILTYVFSFEYKGRIAFLDELFLSPNARGLGLGKQTLDFIKEQVKLLDVKIIYLEVEWHNARAQKLYLDKGFVMHNRGMMKWVV